MKNKIPTESQEQQRLVQKLRWLHPDIPFFAIPNGGKRNPAEARRMVLEGVEKGTPDLFIARPSQSYHGLFIELKRRVSHVISEDQLKKHDILREQGYKVEICYGHDHAYKAIKDYLKSN